MSKEETPAVKDLGWANGWRKDPFIVTWCKMKKHKTEETSIRMFVHQVRCDICGYKYKYDSS